MEELTTIVIGVRDLLGAMIAQTPIHHPLAPLQSYKTHINKTESVLTLPAGLGPNLTLMAWFDGWKG